MKRVSLVLLAAALLLTGCGKAEEVRPTGQTEAPTQTMTQATVQAVPQESTAPTVPVDPVEALLQTMTPEEKVGQLFVARCPQENAARDVEQYQLGGYILFARDFEFKTAQEVLQTVSSYQQEAKIPLLIGVDEEGGTVVRASAQFILREEPFRSPQALFAEGGMERILEDTREKDALLTSLGVNVNFAPVADIATDPDDFMYRRSFGQDARATADYTARVVEQMAADNMGSCLKHFPGYGANVDTHTDIAVDRRPMEDFLTGDLLPFASHTAGAGKTAIMVSHNIVTCMDDKLPASLSAEVHRFMREDFGFDGVILTDALDMGAVKEYAESGNIAVEALKAGNDILLICSYKTGIPAILEAVENGTLTQTQVDDACRRVLTWKQNLGLI